MAVFYGNDVFSILVPKNGKKTKKLKNGDPFFFSKVFVFQRIYFKVKEMKTFKISTNYHIRTCRSLKRRAIGKIPSTVFRRTYVVSVGLKMKPLRKRVFQCNTKNNPNFAVKLAERSSHSFLLPI